jgi:hypothetical protein
LTPLVFVAIAQPVETIEPAEQERNDERGERDSGKDKVRELRWIVPAERVSCDDHLDGGVICIP